MSLSSMLAALSAAKIFREVLSTAALTLFAVALCRSTPTRMTARSGVTFTSAVPVVFTTFGGAWCLTLRQAECKTHHSHNREFSHCYPPACCKNVRLAQRCEANSRMMLMVGDTRQ